MDREQARQMFSRYHDGDLGDEERRELELFLEGDREAHEEWEAFRSTVEEVSGLHDLHPPNDFTRSIQQTIRRRSRGRFFSQQRPFSVHFAFVSFVLILLFILVYLLLTSTSEIRLGEPAVPSEHSEDLKGEERGAADR
jgi:anti-sigma factor RsiW